MDMLYNLSNPLDKQRFKTRCNQLYRDGKCVTLTVEVEKRTLSQNAYLHLLIAYFAAEYGVTAEQAKVDFYKRAANRELYVETIVNAAGHEVQRLRSSSALTLDEMALSIDRFKVWAAQEAGIYLPDADSTEQLTEARRVVEQNKIYL